MTLIAEILTLIVAVIIIYVLWKILENATELAVNSIIGIIAFWALNQFFGLGIPINWLSILVVALAGIPGVILVVLMHFLGLGF
jgi:inhibitor of the pro-sigma K processing machinery